MKTGFEVIANGIFWLWLLALLPVAVISILKERLLMFATGWLTLGITWFIAALSRADPRTWWAQHFYGKERMARAEQPTRHRVPVRVAALCLGGTAALILAIGAFAARPTPILGYDGRGLQHSVWSGMDGFPCDRLEGRAWLCYAGIEGDSSAMRYRVKMRGLGCWRGVPEHGVSRIAGPISGCITVWDELSLL